VLTFVLMASKVLDVGHHLSGVVDVNSWIDLRLVLGMGMFKPLSRQVRSQSLPSTCSRQAFCSWYNMQLSVTQPPPPPHR
jgi:hypothetical protein